MASAVDLPQVHSPPGHDAKRPRGILKNPSHPRAAPPASPQRENSLSEKEVTIENTQINAGHCRSSSAARPPGSRRHSAHNSEEAAEPPMRLKWDEANLYLTEQDRTATMKITEPKTPYAKHYDPAEDPSDDDEAPGAVGDAGARRKASRARVEDDIPGLSLGEPEEEIDEDEAAASTAARGSSEKSVHVDDESVGHNAEEDMVGLSPEEREKHLKFEAMRKKHYEMKNVAHLLGHPEDLMDDDDDDNDDDTAVPAVPRVPNGSA